jgi:hypothetical protein
LRSPRASARIRAARTTARTFPSLAIWPASRFTVVRQTTGGLEITDAPVEFTYVRPGETLLRDKVAAE